MGTCNILTAQWQHASQSDHGVCYLTNCIQQGQVGLYHFTPDAGQTSLARTAPCVCAVIKVKLVPSSSLCACRCGRIYKRFSKSIDASRSGCGLCWAQLAFLGRFAADGSRVKERAGNPYSSFVQEHFAAVKAAQPPGTPHREVMRELSNRWRSSQATPLSPAPLA